MISLSQRSLRVHLPPHAEHAARRLRQHWRQALCGAFVLGAALGADMARSALPGWGDHSLIVLLEMMAVIKGGMVAAAFGAVYWRFTRPVTPTMGLGYCATGAMMAASVLPIWHATHLIAAAALFHGGLLSFLALAYADRGGVTRMLADVNSLRTTR